ncbi:hypothetical protein PRZ48_009389 [Zasmidium cellare]|uniref:Uncharacterized protein n=1 Tax=Zasmidium cellare TaxID=395010 RepID=A0ABR0EBK2_ZASCE|nr:hypothetical protein PRZ48_009389 [Zasmidium cellare]
MWEVCNFPADPDIAGIGVVLSFFISVTLSFLLAVYGFYFVKGSYVPDQLTTLDIVLTGPINALIESFFPNRKPVITREVFREVILLFGDQQLITGLAILTVAFCRFGSITEYHFAVVTDLGNLALVVQFTASDILGEAVGQRPEMVWWRAIAFVTLAVLSTITLIPWCNRYYLHSYGSRMSCLWRKTSGNYTAGLTIQMTLYMILSLWGIIEVLSNYFPVIANNRFLKSIGSKLVYCILWPRRQYITMKQLPDASLASNILREALGGVTVLIFILSELLYAEAFVLARNWSMLLLNVVDVFQLRSVAAEHGRLGNEDSWGFGQAVSMLMLILPLCTLFELYWGRNRTLTTEQRSSIHKIRKHQSHSSCDGSSQLSVPLLKGSRPPSSTLGHTDATAPELYVADETNLGNYYFSYPAIKMGPTDLEDQLYRTMWFRMLLRVIMVLLFAGMTVAAYFGWAI